jgi:protein-tyrosine phosphatase
MSRILFLCTGNYYRSRFAEAYFNHAAQRDGVPWRADSKALARDLRATGNRGPISAHALALLAAHGVPARGEPRWPARVEAPDFHRYPRIIALSRREHEPMMQALFPEHATRIEYLEIGDVDVETPEAAITRLAQALDALAAELRAASQP